MWFAIRSVLKVIFGISFAVTGLFFAFGGFLCIACLASNDTLSAFHVFLRHWLFSFYASIVLGFIYFLLDEF